MERKRKSVKKQRVVELLVRSNNADTMLTSSPPVYAKKESLNHHKKSGCIMWVHLKSSICTEKSHNSMSVNLSKKKPKTIHRCFLHQLSKSKERRLKCHVCNAMYDRYQDYYDHLINRTCTRRQELMKEMNRQDYINNNNSSNNIGVFQMPSPELESADLPRLKRRPSSLRMVRPPKRGRKPRQQQEEQEHFTFEDPEVIVIDAAESGSTQIITIDNNENVQSGEENLDEIVILTEPFNVILQEETTTSTAPVTTLSTPLLSAMATTSAVHSSSTSPIPRSIPALTASRTTTATTTSPAGVRNTPSLAATTTSASTMSIRTMDTGYATAATANSTTTTATRHVEEGQQGNEIEPMNLSRKSYYCALCRENRISLLDHAADSSIIKHLKVQMTELLIAVVGKEKLNLMGFGSQGRKDVLTIVREFLSVTGKSTAEVQNEDERDNDDECQCENHDEMKQFSKVRNEACEAKKMAEMLVQITFPDRTNLNISCALAEATKQLH